jgi:urease accessory protein
LNGLLQLRAGVRADGRTFLRTCAAEFPVQVTRPRALEPDGRLELIVLLQSGGLLDGDALTVEVHLEPGARLALRTQAATQVHCGASSQLSHVRLEAGAAFSYLPHALVPHAGADFVSRTEIDMDPSARALCAETLSPGRVAFGEEFQYGRVRLQLDAWCGEMRVARERATLVPDPALRVPQFGDWTHVATAYVLGNVGEPLRGVPAGDGAPGDAGNRLAHTARCEVSELARGGWLVRGLARRAEDLDRALAEVGGGFWS